MADSVHAELTMDCVTSLVIPTIYHSLSVSTGNMVSQREFLMFLVLLK